MAENGVMVVGVDGSRSAADAAKWAAAVASRRRCGLRVVYVLRESRRPSTAPAVAGREPSAAEGYQAAKAIVTDVVTVVRAYFPWLEVEGLVESGPVAVALAAASEGARMIVLGHSGSGGGALEALLRRSTAQDLVRRAACPVASWRGQPGRLPDDQRPVVVGIEPGPRGVTVALTAFELAALFGTSVVAVHAWFSLPGVTAAPHDMPSEVLIAAREQFPQVAVAEVSVEDDPSAALLEYAGEAQLICVGSHGRGRFAGAVVGSVSREVLQRSECPVVICPPAS